MTEHIPKTKIICTIGPASESSGMIRRLIQNGMSIARLNFSHGTLAEHSEKIFTIRKISEEVGKPMAILQDLAGPKIRIGHVPEPGIRLETGDDFILTTRQAEGSQKKVSVSDPYLPEEVKAGDRVLLADGFLELKVTAIKEQEIFCDVLTGGILTSNKGINLPEGSVRAPSMTEKDMEDLVLGLEKGVDYVALSFVRNADNIMKAREIIRGKGKDTPIIAKIEKHEAIDNIKEILKASDGIMVARGDLGVEIPLEKVPVIQKRLVRMANDLGKPVIIATQMLRSMVDSPRPTRAEASDIANAILDGTDAIMLSEETAVGHYPVEAVGFMARIALNAEEVYPREKYKKVSRGDHTSESVAYSASVLAERINARAIIAPTRSGRTAMRISSFRPPCPVIAFSPNPETVQRLSVVWGCFPYFLPDLLEGDDIIKQASISALETGLVVKEDLIVITAGTPSSGEQTTNMIQVIRL